MNMVCTKCYDIHEAATPCTAHNLILRWCRSDDSSRACHAQVGMRQPYGTTRCKVISLDRTEAKPGGDEWDRQPITYADGATWDECLTQLRAKKLINE